MSEEVALAAADRTRRRTWGYLVDDAPFGEIFPDGRVPLVSIWPIIPREEGAPPCYIVDGAQLSEEQLAALAHMVYEQWRPECESVEQAADDIRAQGLPLRTTWFGTVMTTRMGLVNLP